MGTIYMIRHGQASFGSENYDRLSETGIIQARVAARHLAAAGIEPDLFYSGEMKRQRDTAAETIQLFRNVDTAASDYRMDISFNEYPSHDILLAFAGKAAGMEIASHDDIIRAFADKKKFQALFEKILSGWATGQYRGDGLPTWEEFTGRVWGGMERVMAENPSGRTILIFTSGGPISAAIQRALGLSCEATIRIGWQIANASITKFIYKKDRFALSSFNETAHLALQRETNLITYR
jgi:broad specificity phosphatase PhoE